jgi:hypothetical protein
MGQRITTAMRQRLPIPCTWQDFEALCHQLWKEIWSDPNAQRHGRAGQSQQGVDIFGHPLYSTGYAGIQCKDKDGRLGSTLRKDELMAECKDAKQFSPPLQAFTIATTAARNVDLQTTARMLNSTGTFPFDVHVWSWEDIEDEVRCRPTLLNAFYGSVPIADAGNRVVIAASAPRDQFVAFFSRPEIRHRLSPTIRDNATQLAYELCDNAFVHGRAQRVKLILTRSKLEIEDDGTAFDPLTQLDRRKSSVAGHLGSLVVRTFLDRFGNDVTVNYRRSKRSNSYKNVLSIVFGDLSRYDASMEVLDIAVDMSVTFGRAGAKRLAESLVIPIAIKELVLTFTDSLFLSCVAELIRCVRARLPSDVLLTVSYPRHGLPDIFLEVFRNSSVDFKPR